METLIIFFIFVLIIGLCIGSFLNVVILRALSEESIVFPASKCPKCQTPLKWWHNIPVLSYIMLRGKCAFCKEKISIQYPIIELFTGIIFVLIFLKFQFTLNTIFFWIYASLLIVIAGTDIKEKVVFDKHTYSLIGAGLVLGLIKTIIAYINYNNLPSNIHYLTFWDNPLTQAIIGALAGAIIMELLARLGYIFAGTRAFGEGDSYIAAGLGAVFGWQNLLIVLLYSVIIQIIIFIPLFLYGLIKNKDYKTLISFLVFIVYAGIFYLLQIKNLINNEYIGIIGAIILALLGIISCKFIFAGLKNNPETRTYMPFGPAMVLSALIAIMLIP